MAQASTTTAAGTPTGTATRPSAGVSAPDQVAAHLRNLIAEGQLRTGDKVGQDAIANELGVSRIPVREALIQMERDGLIESKPNVGAFVAPFDEDVIHDHFEVLAAVQVIAAQRVVKRADRGVLLRLREIADAVQQTDDPQVANDLGFEFHRVVNRASGSHRLQSVLRGLSRVMPAELFAYLPGAITVQRNGIASMADAIESGSTSKIRKAFTDVNLRRAELLIDELRRRGTFL